MLEDYKSALRAGQRAYRARISRGQSPYLAVLDDVLKGVDIVAQEPLGLSPHSSPMSSMLFFPKLWST